MNLGLVRMLFAVPHPTNCGGCPGTYFQQSAAFGTKMRPGIISTPALCEASDQLAVLPVLVSIQRPHLAPSALQLIVEHYMGQRSATEKHLFGRCSDVSNILRHG
jgi:hypothetical protein